MYDQERAGKLGWCSRIEIIYTQPHPEKKISELFFLRGYSGTDLSVFRTRLDRDVSSVSHKRSEIKSVPYDEIDDVILLSGANQETGELVRKILSEGK